MNSNIKKLPWVCPDHPTAQIRHIWDRTRTEINWGPNRPKNLLSEQDNNHRYECSICKLELAPPN